MTGNTAFWLAVLSSPWWAPYLWDRYIYKGMRCRKCKGARELKSAMRKGAFRTCPRCDGTGLKRGA